MSIYMYTYIGIKTIPNHRCMDIYVYDSIYVYINTKFPVTDVSLLKTSSCHLKLGQQCCDTDGQYHEIWN